MADRIPLIRDASTNLPSELRSGDTISSTLISGLLADAPVDGNTYGRKNSLWQSISASFATSTGFQVGNVLVQTGSDSAPIPSSSTATSKAVVFPTTYATTLWVGVSPTTAGVTSSGYNAVPAISTKLTTGFTVTLDAEGGGGNNINKIINFDWLAIGVLPPIGTLTLTGTYPAAFIGVPYSHSLAITGGVSPYSLSGGTGLASGTLPAGLALSIVGSTLVLSGTPTTAATSTFTVSILSTDLQTATSNQSVNASISTDPYFTQVMSDNPYLYWRLDETTGTTATDISGNARNGLYTSAASFTTSTGLLTTSANKGMVTPGTSSTPLRCGTTTTSPFPVVNTLLDFSAGIIATPSSAPPSSGVGVLFELGTAQFCPEVDVLDIGSGKFRLRVMSASAALLFSSVASFNYGTRVVVVMTYNATTHLISLYINGSLDSTGTHTYIAHGGTLIACDGVGTFGGFPFIGSIDEHTQFQSCLTATRVAAQFAAS